MKSLSKIDSGERPQIGWILHITNEGVGWFVIRYLMLNGVLLVEFEKSCCLSLFSRLIFFFILKTTEVANVACIYTNTSPGYR